MRRETGLRWKRQIAQVMEIPQDLACRDVLLTLLGEQELQIENFKGLGEITETHIWIKTWHRDLHILGNHLLILYYNNQDIKITGQITNIYYE